MLSKTFIDRMDAEGFTAKMFTDAGKVYYAATREFNGNGAMFSFIVRDLGLSPRPECIIGFHPHFGPALLWLLDRGGLNVFHTNIQLLDIFGYLWRLADAPDEHLELFASNLLRRLRAMPGYSMDDETSIIAHYASGANFAPETTILAVTTSPSPEFTKMLLLKLKDRFEVTSSEKIKTEIFEKLKTVKVGKYYQ